MRIDLSKRIFTNKEIKFILSRLKLAFEMGYLQKRHENNHYLLASYSGIENKGITPKWNVKIYTYNARKQGHSIVCVDKFVLGKLIEKEYHSFIPPDLKVLRIDDAGWGFPLCGIMVGVSDECEVKNAVIPIEYFRNDTENSFITKRYLDKYTNLAIGLINEFGASPKTHRIEICSGYVNQPLREKLRRLDFDVRIVEIKGMLQEKLESIYREYVFNEINADIYYDPKEMKKSDIPGMYYKCLRYGLRYCPHQIKTGWKSINRITDNPKNPFDYK